MLMRAYFDESGTHDASRIVAIAGYVATQEVWAAVEAAWRDVLAEWAPFGVQVFHMTDCILGEGDFSRLEAPYRNRIITQFSEILRDADIQAVWSFVEKDQWHLAKAEPAFLARFPKPLHLAFEHVMRQLGQWAAQKATGELVCPVFAYNSEYTDRMAEVGAMYGASPVYKEVLGPIAFGSPSHLIPLQAADLLVHQIRWDWVKEDQIGPTLALARATAFKGMRLGGGFGETGLRNSIESFLKTGAI
jgi:hypothetical protein